MADVMTIEMAKEKTNKLIAAMPENVDGEKLKASIRMLEKKSNAMLEEAQFIGEIDPIIEKAIQLIKDEAFKEKFLLCENSQSIQKLFEENGAPLLMEDVEDIVNAVGLTVIKTVENNGELSDEELEQISGGWGWFKNLAKSAKGALIGAVSGVVLGAIYAGVCIASIACPAVGVAVAAAAFCLIAGGAIGAGSGAAGGAIADALS